jgi:hypothetical protein
MTRRAARLFLHMEQYAKQNDFLIARNCHTYGIEKSKMLFGAASKEQRVISRGSFYCRGANNCKCHFQLKFTYVSEDGFYVVKGNDFNLEHTEHARTNETLHGLENVQFKQQLRKRNLCTYATCQNLEIPWASFETGCGRSSFS